MNIEQLAYALQTLTIVLSLANIAAIFFTLDRRQRLFQFVFVALWLLAALAAWFGYQALTLILQVMALLGLVYALRIKNTWKQQQTRCPVPDDC
jgi:hypothetical protein